MTLLRLSPLLVLLLLVIMPGHAGATSCSTPAPEERIRQNEIIFKGRAASQQPITDQKDKSDGYNTATLSTKFEISTVYKGDVADAVDIVQMRDPWGDEGLQVGHEYIIFTGRALRTSLCNPFIDVGSFFSSGDSPHYKAQIEALDDMKDELDDKEDDAQSDDTEEAYIEFGDALEKYADYMRAEKTYARLLAKQQSEFTEDDDTWGEATPFATAGKCAGKYAADEKTPDFLKTPHDGRYNLSAALLMRYGRVLVRQGRHAEAMRPLCFADDILGSKDARNLKILTLLHTGNAIDVKDGPYDFSGAELGVLRVSGMDLSNWNFANTAVSLIGEDVILDGANFSGAHIDGNISRGSFKGANLKGTKMRMNIDGADFTGANLSQTKIWNSSLTHIKFIGANLSGAEIYADTANNIDFSNANMAGVNLSEYFGVKSGQNIALENADLTGATLGGLKLENADFGTAELKNANFSARTPYGNKYVTTLYGADLSSAKSIDTATFDGALYDCRTKFPDGFPADVFLTLMPAEGCTAAEKEPARFPDHKKEREARHAKFPYRGRILEKNFGYKAGDNFDGARVTRDAILPPEALRYKLIPTSIVNGKGSPWEFSHVGRSEGRCGKNTFSGTGPYAPPKIPIPNLSGMDLSFLEFYSAWLPAANISNAKLMHADFSSGHFVGANFSGADMEGIVLFNSVADKADFSNANLRKADLRLTRLWDANFTGADLKGAIYDINTVWPTGFNPVKAGARRESPRNPYDGKLVMPRDESKRFAEFRIPGLPDNAEMIGIGAYGKSKDDTDIYVTVGRKGAPLILVLNGAYDINWNVEVFPEAKVLAIIITSGEANDMPSDIKVYEYQNIGKKGPKNSTHKCGRQFDDYQDMMRAVTGRNFTRYLDSGDMGKKNRSDDIFYQYVVN